MNDTKYNTTDILVKALAVVGVIAIILIGLWGTVQVVRFVPQAFSTAAVTLTSIFKPAEHIEISVSSLTASHGDIFTLSWEHKNKGNNTEGSYSVQYSCQGDFFFETLLPDDTFGRTSCDTPFNFVEAENEIRLIPISEENRFLDVVVSVAFTPFDGGSPIFDDVLLTIENKSISESPSTNGDAPGGAGSGSETVGEKIEETRQISGGGAVSNSLGQTDLSVRILEIGYIEGVNNTFYATSSVEIRQRAAARFVIENLGTKTSPQWTFNAVLPTKTIYIFDSKTQPALAPGERIEYTIGFDKIKSGPAETITINVDPTHSINEVTRANNIAKAELGVFKIK